MTIAPGATACRQLSPAADIVWLLWDCTEPVGVFTTEAAALDSRADLQHQLLLCDYGPIPELLETITITTALLNPQHPSAIQAHP